jgi:hypothetical protein
LGQRGIGPQYATALQGTQVRGFPAALQPTNESIVLVLVLFLILLLDPPAMTKDDDEDEDEDEQRLG